MRGAGCTINDMWDRDVDRQVERTRARPLASGALSMPQALGFLSAQCGVGLGVLLALPPYAVALSFASVPLVCLYPLAKRVSGWPQAVLGLTFNWGALVGWAAVHGSCEWATVLPLYAGGFWWTLLYDTIYAHQDKLDDARVGVGSTALSLGDGALARASLALFGGGAVGGLALAGTAAGLPLGFSDGAPTPLSATLAAGALHLGWQAVAVDLSSPDDCLRKFRSNHSFGALIFAGIVAGKLLLDADTEANHTKDEEGARAPPRPQRMLWVLLPRREAEP